MVVQQAASVPPGTDATPATVSAYWRFHAAVTRAQLIAWLPSGRRTVIDVSGPRADSAMIAAMAGHNVVRVYEAGCLPDGRAGTPLPGRVAALVGDAAGLRFLPDGCADGVIAGDRTLSTHLAAEAMVAEIARVLRPGGRVLASVDSLVLGMALLADQQHWPHLADLPHAEVVLIPWPDGTITRCYGPDQLRELFAGAGLSVNWIRPLTIISPATVAYALRQDPASLPALVRTELRATPDESTTGTQLLISARKRAQQPA